MTAVNNESAINLVFGVNLRGVFFLSVSVLLYLVSGHMIPQWGIQG